MNPMSRPHGGVAARSARLGAAIVTGALLIVLLPQISGAVIGAPTITTPADGALVGAVAPAMVTIRGTAAPTVGVEVSHALGGSIGTTTADGSGNWSLAASLADGSHTITAVATDADGTSPPSAPVTFEVDAVRPTISIGAPENNHVFAAGQQVTISGTAADERMIHAIRIEFWLLSSLVRAELADCPGCGAGGSSEWTLIPANLQPGAYTVKAIAFDAAANRSNPSSVAFVASGTPGSPVETPEIEVPEAPEVPNLLEPDDGELMPGESEPMRFSGTTEPGSMVEVHEEIAGLGTIGSTVDSDRDGQWSIAVDLPTGSYGVRVQATDEEGNVSDLGDLIAFDVDAGLPTLGNLTAGNTVFGPTDAVVLEGKVFDDRQAVAVVLEYWLLDDLVLQQAAECLACPEQEAAWHHVPQGLKPGYYYVKVRAIDAAGQRSTWAEITFTKLGAA